MSMRIYEDAMFNIGSSFRRTLNSEVKRYPWNYWLRIAYNDALTYDPITKKGGLKASWRFREFSRAP